MLTLNDKRQIAALVKDGLFDRLIAELRTDIVNTLLDDTVISTADEREALYQLSCTTGHLNTKVQECVNTEFLEGDFK